LGDVEGVGGRSGAAAGHNLDLVGALAEVFASGASDGVGAIGDEGRRSEGMVLVGRAQVVVGSRVAVAASLRDEAAADEHARASNETTTHGLLEAPGAAAGVPDGSEAESK